MEFCHIYRFCQAFFLSPIAISDLTFCQPLYLVSYTQFILREIQLSNFNWLGFDWHFFCLFLLIYPFLHKKII